MEFTQLSKTIVESGLLPLFIFVAILCTVKLGWHIGNHSHHRSKGSRTVSDDTLIGAILGLMALLIGFTFNGAAGRLDQRERLIVAEASAVGSAYNALSPLNLANQASLQHAFRSYLDLRLDLYTDVLDEAAFKQKQQHAEAALQEIRQQAVTAVQNVPLADRGLATDLITQINNMIGVYHSQRQAMWFHPPRIIWISLLLLVIIGSFLAGYKMGLSQRRERFLPIMFALIMSCAIYLILSLEFPLLGHVNLDTYNQEFLRVRDAIPVSAPASR